jgi:acylphosphatase
VNSSPADAVIKLRVRGRVQGVGFRRSLEIKARALDLAGWVRNRADGSVEALLAGDPDAVAELCEWARSGPPMARVDALETSESEGTEAGESPPYPFALRATF